jgi:hypothetical protein
VVTGLYRILSLWYTYAGMALTISYTSTSLVRQVAECICSVPEGMGGGA